MKAAHAQLSNPVYVDDSPQAWELILRARAHRAENAGEAVRQYQELLDDYGARLIPRRAGVSDEFVDVRTAVLADLAADADLLDRYRLMQTAEAERLLRAGELERLALTRPLTGPGLVALLRLGQDALETARFHGALARLEQAIGHPDLADSRSPRGGLVHAWLMLGTAAHYLGDADRLARARAALAAAGSGGATALAELDRLGAEGSGPVIARGVSPLDASTTSGLTDLVAQTIWSQPIELSRSRVRPVDAFTFPPPPAEAPRGLDRAGIAATVAGAAVYLNDGAAVHALDRFTGRLIWSRSYAPSRIIQLPDRDTDGAGDLSLVSVTGTTLVTLTGNPAVRARDAGGSVLCLDAQTGDVRWVRSLDRIGDDDENEGLFPHGAAIIGEGAVFVLARKTSAQQLTGAYVVALDLDDGAVRWIRHVASSGSKQNVPRPLSTLVGHGRDLIVATPVGAIACLDSTTGTIRWLKRWSVPVNVRTGARFPWQIASAAVVRDRVIAITPDQRRIAVFDLASGEEQASFDARLRSGWNAPEYLLAADDLVFGVGTEIRAFALDALDRPQWQLPPLATSGADEAPSAIVADDSAGVDLALMTIAGRVQSVDLGLVVPTFDGILLLDRETGAILHRLAIESPGNPVAEGSQLIVAGAQTIDAYMSLARAEAMLRERIAAAPRDPAPALSLLQLGARVGDLALALEAAGIVLAGIDRAPPAAGDGDARGELFEMLLALHRRGPGGDAQLADALYAMIDRVASTADQQVEARLAHADGVADRAPAQAVELYQQVLSDPLLAAAVRSEDSIARPAAQWVTERLGRLIEGKGAAVYRPHADFAQRALAHLRADRPADDGPFLALALEFPFAPTAVDAALQAAALRRDRGDVHGAVATLGAAAAALPGAAARRRLLGELVELCVADGEIAHAQRILRSLDLPLVTASGERTADEWLAALGADRAAGRVPRGGAHLGATQRIPGRLVAMVNGDVALPPGRALVLNGRSDLSLLVARPAAAGPGRLDTAWTAAIDDPSARLLAFDDDGVLLWMGDRESDPRIVCLDPRTGRARWTTPRLSHQADNGFGRDDMAIGQLPDGRPFDPKATMPLLDGRRAYMIRATGAVVAFERGGGTAQWVLESTMEEVHHVALHPYALVLVGRDQQFEPRSGTLVPVPRIVVVDPATGRIVHQLHPQSSVVWAQLDPLGTLLCASDLGLELIDVLAGRRRWMTMSYDAQDSRRGFAAGAHVIVETRASVLFAVDLADGRLSPPFDAAVRGDWDRGSLAAVTADRGRIFARYRDRIVRYDAAGNVLGADVIMDEPREYDALVVTDRGAIVVGSRGEGGLEEIGVPGARIGVVWMLSDDCRVDAMHALGDGEDPVIRDVLAIDGWLLLSTAGETLAVALLP
jgi:outer membrane protein assembly factor BamB